MKHLQKLNEILTDYYKHDGFTNTKSVEYLLLNLPKIKEELAELVAEIDRHDIPDNLDRAFRLLEGGYQSHRIELKNAFHKLAKAKLTEIANRLSLKEFEVNTNKAGPAVLGDTYLMGMDEEGRGICITLGESNFMRSIKHLKDYTGGKNVSISRNGFVESQIIRTAMAVLHSNE